MKIRSLSACLASGISLLSILGNPVIVLAQTSIDNGQTVKVPESHISPWNIGGFLFVGDSNTGTLEISGAGYVSNTFGVIGNVLGSNGDVMVSGNGSRWDSSRYLFVGYYGHGTLTISDGGRVSSVEDATIGFFDTGSGNVTVSGNGSQWINSENLYVGYSGYGTLAIFNGGLVVTGMDGTIGADSGGAGIVTVSGIGSQWNSSENLSVGYYGNGTLTVSDKGHVSNTDGFIGFDSDGTGKVVVTGSGSTWTNNGDLTAGYSGSGQLTISNGGTVNATAVILADSAGSSGTINIGAEAGTGALPPGTLNATGVFFGSGNGILVFNHTFMESDNYVFSAPISGMGTVDVLAGVTILTGSNTYSGTTTISGGILKAGIEGAFSAGSDFVTGRGGTLDANGLSQTIAGLDNSGMVVVGSDSSVGAVGAMLTMAGNYTGRNGALVLRTVLGDDSSATDQLIVGGTASGNTLVSIVPAGGRGAQTVGDGILIIRTGSSPSNAFALSSRVAAGAYNYHLYQGGNATTGGDPADQNWYLRSTIRIDNPEPLPAAAIEVPDYRAEVPLMASVTPVALEYGYAMLGTLHERVGEVWPINLPPVYEDRIIKGGNGKTQVVRVPAIQTDQGKFMSSGWARVIGDRGLRDNNHNFERRGPDYNYTFTGIQAGLDVFARERSDGTLDRAGFYAGYGNIDMDVKGAWSGKAGSIDMDAFTLGAYWTHQAARGWYTDAVVQGSWYSAEANSVEGQKLKPDGFGIIASLEGGYSFRLGNGLTIEPQAQLAYQNVSFDGVSDAYGYFRLSDQESLRGRLGVRIAKAWALSEAATPRMVSTWVRANVWHEFMGDATTAVSGLDGTYSAAILSSLDGTWGEIGAGISGQITDTVSLFATAAYNRSLDNKGQEAWNGRLGMTVKW